MYLALYTHKQPKVAWTTDLNSKMELMVRSWTNNDEFVERMKCFRKKTSGETEYLTQLNTKTESGSATYSTHT